MVFQVFEALYINCELGSGVIRKASFLFDSKEYKDIGILYLRGGGSALIFVRTQF